MGTIIVGVDGSDGSRAALIWAASEARRRKQRLLVLHTWHLPPVGGPFSNEVAVLASDVIAKAASHLVSTMVAEAQSVAGDKVEVVGETVAGSAAAELIRRSPDASMLVVGSRGLGGFRGLLLGSISRQCVHHARCPVVVVPHPGQLGKESAA